jgi:hypothetical protein
MATPINSPVTPTPLLKNGKRETRLLTVSQASANISEDIGKYWDAVMFLCCSYRLSRKMDKESQ